ncbi:MAG TPA: zinc-dependent alcohol dehydrogenase family protein [Candidatus Aquicultoraceae bacterium]|nr:zinc-dependent alcohol dehydrogenase family protein [Candidatus Aquicultoraceae bacterium]
MKAMLLDKRGPIETSPLVRTDLADPSPGPGEIRVKVSVCGICRTDLHVIEGDLPPVRSPLIPGHQVVGTVDAAGEGADRFPRGTPVGIAWLAGTCGECEFCSAGKENLCDRPSFTGYHRHGGFAEFAVVPEAFAYRLPPGFRDEEAAPLLCAGIIGFRALRRADLPPGGRLAIYGFGSSAHIVIQIALHRGCEVFVVSRGENHRRLAMRMGASWAGENPDRMPAPADSAILFAPAGELVPVALKHLQKGGTLSLAGIHMSDIPAMNYRECLFHERNVRSVTANTRRDGEELLREAAQIPIRPRVALFPLEEANRALRMLKEDGLEGTGVLTVGG